MLSGGLSIAYLTSHKDPQKRFTLNGPRATTPVNPISESRSDEYGEGPRGAAGEEEPQREPCKSPELQRAKPRRAYTPAHTSTFLSPQGPEILYLRGIGIAD